MDLQGMEENGVRISTEFEDDEEVGEVGGEGSEEAGGRGEGGRLSSCNIFYKFKICFSFDAII